MQWHKSIMWIGVILVVLFSLYIVWDISTPDQQKTEECYSKLSGENYVQDAIQFCECMDATHIVKQDDLGDDEHICRVGFRDFSIEDFFCKMNPDDSRFNCGLSSSLSSFAPRHDTHIITGLIFEDGNQIGNGAVVTFYNPEKPKEKIVDQAVTNGRYEIDLSYLPSGWRVGDVGILQIRYLGKLTTKTIFVKSTAEQIENILLT